MSRMLRPYFLLASFVIAFCICWFSRNFIFFWDSIQFGSIHAHWYYENNFSSFFLPERWDSGHPPAFGMYIALIWKLFGKTLPASHFSMLPFLTGIIYFSLRLGEIKVGYKNSWWILLLLIANPCFLGHSVLVSPDLALVFFFIGAVWALLEKKNILLLFFIMGLSLISQRGFMLVFCLILWDFYWARSSIKEYSLYRLKYFIPGLLLFLAFFLAHYLKRSWVVVHPDSARFESFQRVGWTGLVKNSMIYIWRILDFGNVYIILAIAYLYLFRSRSVPSKFVTLFWVILVLFALVTLPVAGLLNHRYFLPVYFLMMIILFFMIKWDQLQDRILIVITGVLLFTGNFWIYPKTISQGWDTTPAHIPYYSLYNQMRTQILEMEIRPEAVGTGFPMKSSSKYLTLKEGVSSYKDLSFDRDRYVLWSNICNDFSDSQVEELDKEWEKFINLNNRGISMILYHRK